jgi:hypothetical protein
LRDLVDGSGVGTDGILETFLTYELVGYSNHDVDSQCSVALGAAQNDSDRNYFPDGTVGAATGACVSAVDYPPTGGPGSEVGIWRFSLAPNGPHAEYVDPDVGHPLNGYEIMFVEADCDVKRGDDTGAWTNTTLAELYE